MNKLIKEVIENSNRQSITTVEKKTKAGGTGVLNHNTRDKIKNPKWVNEKLTKNNKNFIYKNGKRILSKDPSEAPALFKERYEEADKLMKSEGKNKSDEDIWMVGQLFSVSESVLLEAGVITKDPKKIQAVKDKYSDPELLKKAGYENWTDAVEKEVEIESIDWKKAEPMLAAAENQVKKYLNEFYSYTDPDGKKHKGEENLISTEVHADERHLHIHINFLPLSRKKDKRKYSLSDQYEYKTPKDGAPITVKHRKPFDRVSDDIIAAAGYEVIELDELDNRGKPLKEYRIEKDGEVKTFRGSQIFIRDPFLSEKEIKEKLKDEYEDKWSVEAQSYTDRSKGLFSLYQKEWYEAMNKIAVKEWGVGEIYPPKRRNFRQRSNAERARQNELYMESQKVEKENAKKKEEIKAVKSKVKEVDEEIEYNKASLKDKQREIKKIRRYQKEAGSIVDDLKAQYNDVVAQLNKAGDRQDMNEDEIERYNELLQEQNRIYTEIERADKEFIENVKAGLSADEKVDAYVRELKKEKTR